MGSGVGEKLGLTDTKNGDYQLRCDRARAFWRGVIMKSRGAIMHYPSGNSCTIVEKR